MMSRPFAAAPLVVAGLALALSATIEAKARDGENATPAAARAVTGTHLPSSYRPGPSRGAGKSRCAWGDCSVTEGRVPEPSPGAVCPPDTANIDDRFCIDKYEASLVEVLPDGHTTPWPPFNAIEDGRTLRAVSASNVYPQAYISGAQAAQACAAAGKRLCAPVEWRKACMGPRHVTFGYGATREPGRCNDQGRSPMGQIFPQVGVSWKLVGMNEMNDPRLNQLAGTLAQTGSHEGCTNEYGVYDMVGNLHEWTNDPHGTFQGGYYLDTHLNGDGCSYRTVAHEMRYHDYSTGFRCCADAAPSP